MKTCAIICEYNPMHLGHAYQLDRVRAQGFDAIVGILSGPFVQRGEPAILDKWDRALIAVQNGMDLVVELPVARALESAQGFASGGVQLASLLPDVTHLAFGVESADRAALLTQVAETLDDPSFQETYRAFVAQGLSTRNAIVEALKEFFSKATAQTAAERNPAAQSGTTIDVFEELFRPNNTLAIQYLRALKKLPECPIEPLFIERIGADEDDIESMGDGNLDFDQIGTDEDDVEKIEESESETAQIDDEEALRKRIGTPQGNPRSHFHPSATMIREEVRKKHWDRIEPHVAAGILPLLQTVDLDTRGQRLTDLLTADDVREEEHYTNTPAFEPGMDQRFLNSFRDLPYDAKDRYRLSIDRAANKRHAKSRFRRMALQSLLRMQRADAQIAPHYLRPLAMNAVGAALLKSAKEADIPIVQKPTLLEQLSLSEEQTRLIELDMRAQALYEFLVGEKRGRDFLEHPYIVK